MSKISGAYDPEIKVFTDAMRYKLHVNRHKGRWEGATVEGLFDKLKEEVQELQDEINSPVQNQTAILLEAADIGNIALMIANIAMKIASGQHYGHREFKLTGVTQEQRDVIKEAKDRIDSIPLSIKSLREKHAPHINANEDQIRSAIGGGTNVSA